MKTDRSVPDNDKFITVGKKGKPLFPTKLRAEAVVTTEDDTNASQSIGPAYHPDFAMPLTPSHVLIRTCDGILFWFSLSLLARYSTVFAEIDHDSLRRFASPKPPSRCLQLPQASSRSFALVLHLILLEWHQGHHNTTHDLPKQLRLPESSLEVDMIGALDDALGTASVLGMENFFRFASRHLVPRVGDVKEKP